MSVSTLEADAPVAPAQPALYRAIWRWHFYAGLLVLPFMILLAVTGGLYLFKDEINAIAYRDQLIVAPVGKAQLKPSDIIAKANAAVAGTLFRYVPPAAADRSAEVGIATANGEKLSVYVDPYTGRVLGSLSDSAASGTPFMLLIRKLHSLDYFGWIANRVIEIAAGWTLVLVITGFYLWWPRGQAGGIVSVRAKPHKRVFWRDLHAVAGALAGLLILFLAITGLPWSGFWGSKLNAYADQWGLGYPPQFWSEIPKSDIHMGHAMTQTSWSLENTPMPQSLPSSTQPIGIDKAKEIFDRLGIAPGYVIDLPDGAEGVYSASVFPDGVANERVVHLDQYSGKPMFNGGFAELGAVGKAIEWGISVHQGQEYGRINQLLMFAGCLSIIVMAVAALVMWWKRRPRGSLGAPRIPADYRIPRTVLIIACIIGVLFPLVGLSLLAMLAIDMVLPRALRERFA